MKYVPGKILHAVPYVPSLLFDVGAYTAMIQDSLKVCCSDILYRNQRKYIICWIMHFLEHCLIERNEPFMCLAHVCEMEHFIIIIISTLYIFFYNTNHYLNALLQSCFLFWLYVCEDFIIISKVLCSIFYLLFFHYKYCTF